MYLELSGIGYPRLIHVYPDSTFVLRIYAGLVTFYWYSWHVLACSNQRLVQHTYGGIVMTSWERGHSGKTMCQTACRCVRLGLTCLGAMVALFIGYSVPLVIMRALCVVLFPKEQTLAVNYLFFGCHLGLEVLWFIACMVGCIWTFKRRGAWRWQRFLVSATLIGSFVLLIQSGVAYTMMFLALLLRTIGP